MSEIDLGPIGFWKSSLIHGFYFRASTNIEINVFYYISNALMFVKSSKY